MSKKYVIVTGGVISGIGKGVTTAATGFFFCEKWKVVPIKLDGYLNIDPGTMNPIEHGEVFVLADGGEVDMDFGHYERFLGTQCKKEQSISMGKVYSSILEKERAGGFLGETVQMIPHVTDHIIDTMESIFENTESDICLIEVGGTVGDIEAELYLEAIRQMKQRKKTEDILHLHLTYVPIPGGVCEQKTKPTQQSLHLLQSRGLFPDIIIARGSETLTEAAKRKISLFSNLDTEHIFSIPDVASIYVIPEILKEQLFIEKIATKLKIAIPQPQKGTVWKSLLQKEKNKNIKIGIVGKYTSLEDSYSSVVSAIEHVSYHTGVHIEIQFISTRKQGYQADIDSCDGCVIPGGFGSSGIENMIDATKYLRENRIPTLGICLGMQIMILEYFRNILQIPQANSLEFDSGCSPYDIITLLETQKDVQKLGGTMRLGEQQTQLEVGKIYELYLRQQRISADGIVSERFRHRYEFNPEFVERLQTEPLSVVGKNTKEGIAQFIEMDSAVHPYYVATQSHPELTSKLENPAPLFLGLVETIIHD